MSKKYRIVKDGCGGYLVQFKGLWSWRTEKTVHYARAFCWSTDKEFASIHDACIYVIAEWKRAEDLKTKGKPVSDMGYIRSMSASFTDKITVTQDGIISW